MRKPSNKADNQQTTSIIFWKEAKNQHFIKHLTPYRQ